jgi:hypothetical protein
MYILQGSHQFLTQVSYMLRDLEAENGYNGDADAFQQVHALWGDVRPTMIKGLAGRTLPSSILS